MSDTLAKTRTVRFSKKLDRTLSAEAARRKVSVSDLIRQAAERLVEAKQECAGDWCLSIAPRKSLRKSDPDLIAAYDRRHK
ncbi:MAG: ribbon-helix-helix protein, CopG family [Verrucomicrobiota bacterium]